MSRKKVIIQNQKWESTKARGQKFTKICDDMQESKAWKELTLRQQGLYLLLKKKYIKRPDDSDNAEDIHITNQDIKNTKLSKNSVMYDLDELINKGFIKVKYHGKLARKPNIYAFSDNWTKYGTDEFFIHPNDKRLTKKNSIPFNDE